MGQDSHYTSNLRVMDYDITGVATITATNAKISGTLSGCTTASVAVLKATSYVQIGAHQYLLVGSGAAATTVAKAATAVDASCQGSLYLSSTGVLFIMTSDTAASRYANI